MAWRRRSRSTDVMIQLVRLSMERIKAVPGLLATVLCVCYPATVSAVNVQRRLVKVSQPTQIDKPHHIKKSLKASIHVAKYSLPSSYVANSTN
jgi:hypothetical protein